MITIQYGGWTPDLANVAFQMPDQEGPVQVPVADCLNVFYANGTYQTLPTASPVAGSPALIGQCLGAFTYKDALGGPVPIAMVSSGWYYWTGSAWQSIGGSGFSDTQYCNYAQFGVQPCAQPVTQNVFEYVVTGAGNVYAGIPSGAGIFSLGQIPGAPYSTVMATVGQFLMVGDIAGPVASAILGTGNGTTTTFTGTIFNSSGGAPPPIYPGSIQITTTTGAGAVTVYDNGAGLITGTGVSSGTVNYDTGLVSITFTSAPLNTQLITGKGAAAYRARLQWSPIGNITPAGGWPVPLTNAALAVQSGIQDQEYAYGPIMFIAGYPLYGVIFQRNAIARATYIGGNVVFSWQTYSRTLGLVAKGAAIQVGPNTYFLSDQGFFYTDGANVTPIGTAQDNSAGIDGWFWSNVNKSALGAIRAGYDGFRRNVMFAIPTGSNTLPDTLLCYNILSARWTRAQQSSEFTWSDTDGTINRIGMFDQAHRYSLLTSLPSAGYLESCDLSFSDGLTRFTPSTRPNIACTDTPTATIGIRNTLESSVTYSLAGTADAFGAGFAPTLTQKGIYTRVRVSSGSASAINGATMKMRPGGPL